MHGDEHNIQWLLTAARTSLDMDLAYVTDVGEQSQRIAYLSGDGTAFGVHPGDRVPVQDSMCARMLSGELPLAVGDTVHDPSTRDVPTVHEHHVAAYASVPLVLSSGRVYGALCVTATDPRPGLDDSSVAFLHFLARMLSSEIGHVEHQGATDRSRADVSAFLEPGAIVVFGQPIVDLSTGDAVGIEALSRFPGTAVGPADMFAAAHDIGLGLDLEVAAFAAAIATMHQLPTHLAMAVNASPDLVTHHDLLDLVRRTAQPDEAERLVVELTEHVTFGDLTELRARLDLLRGHGIRIALDDTGAGYSGMQIIMAVSPDVIKLDLALVRAVDRDPVRRALIRSMVGFAHETGANLLAEGIETASELDTLRELGVTRGQGFHLAPPAPISELTTSNAPLMSGLAAS